MKQNIKQKKELPKQIFVKAYDVAASYDLKSAREILQKEFSGKILHQNPLLVSTGSNKMATVFDYGSIVFFNFSQPEITEILDTLRSSAYRPNKRINEDDFILNPAPQYRSPEGTEEWFIKEFNRDIALVVSIVLSRSVSLEYYERIVSDTLAGLEKTVTNLAATGKIQRDDVPLTKQVGLAISVEQELAYNISIFDDPDVLWLGGKRIDALYKSLKREFDLEDRTKIIQQKISIISRTSTFILSRLEARRSQILEWIIIILIFTEIVLALLKIV
ncbi:MAG: RMD1 family protein [Bacteroidetes bacterium]|nr:RMD1 family protein [Bacteroidota bacterium]